VRWRLWDRTGGGIMAELGSHQLDAASIFISALKNRGKPRHQWDMVHPLTVHTVGGRHVFPHDRDIGDHVYCLLEFPAPGYDPVAPENADLDARKKLAAKRYGYMDRVTGQPLEGLPSYEDDHTRRIVYMYSSINGCGFGGYGETVMGTRRTMVIEKEQETMLFNNKETTSSVSLDDSDVIDTQASGPAVAIAQSNAAVSRGYAEEIEHWAYCIRNRDPENTPRCNGKVALGDAVVALTTTLALRRASQAPRGKNVAGFVEFKDEWFDPKKPDTPEEDLGISLT
jgi:predicted dehydrogenase